MAKVTIESAGGVKGGFVCAYGLAYTADKMKKIPNEDLKSHIERVRDLKIRDDDVYLATYPKSGTHWSWEIIVMLRRGSAEYEPSPKGAVFLDFKGPDIIDKVSSPRVLNCHWPCSLTPRGIFDKNIKIVHVQRNPKDIIVSLYYFHKNLGGRPFTESFQEFLPLTLGTYGIFQFYPWYKYVKEWERFTKTHPEQILNLYFEDMKEDPVREIKKIDKFLGTGRNDELIQQIAQACHFDNLKKADLEIKEKEHMTQGRKPSIMYRKGEVGDWKNHFTVAQNAEIDEWLQENLAETELKFRYTI